DSAQRFLELLVARGALLLDPDADRAALARGAARWFTATPEIARRGRGAALAAWLLDQEGVAELYLDDDAMEALLEAW
ncbi:MAG TPA: hypothetical protein VLS89_19095, partial [Candidatus Nanopelagicales bacterium]|nr:hypothetical protein [Candidatus Nanopelagicales bacterium]